MRECRRDGFPRPASSRSLLATLIVTLALATRLAGAQAPGAGIEERLILENDTVRVVLLLFPPGSASGEHVGREVLGPGAARWLPALVTHDARNEGSVPLKLWVVLVKK